MPISLQAALWGLLGGSSLLLGAWVACTVRMPPRAVASILAFGCGVLISAVAYDLLMEGFGHGGATPVVVGMLAGSLIYTLINMRLTHHGGRSHKGRPGKAPAAAATGGGLAIAVGSMLDGVPESIVLGISLLSEDGVSVAMLVAIVLSNFPEALSGATDMRAAGKSHRYVFAVWGGVALLSGIAAGLGVLFLGSASPTTQAVINALAAGALLTMIADTMIPEAVKDAHNGTGLLVVLGLLCAFLLSHAG